MTRQQLKLIWLLALLSSSQAAFTQSFTGRDQIIDMLDGVQYDVPGFGTIEFEYSKKSDNRQSLIDGYQWDEKQKVPFLIRVKRSQEKKFERDDYFAWLEMPSYFESETGRTNYESPNEKYWATFTISRDAIYQIKDFPSLYVIFADGDLYYQDWQWTEYSFAEAKDRYLNKDIADEESLDIEYKRCFRID